MLLEVIKIHTYYGLSHVLQGVSLNVADGEFVCLLGRNGMGKSTTLKTVMGLVKPRSGKVVLNGQDITGFAPFKTAQAGVGYVPEERRIFPDLSVVENLELGIKGGKFKNQKDPHRWTFDRIFKHFPKLKERGSSQGRFLSGGEQQMLAIGRSLMGNPKLLLVDEPTEGLAPIMVQEVRNVLEEISKTSGVAILLVEHNLKVALSLAQRVYLMGKAHIGYTGSVEDLKTNDEVRQKYLEV